MQEPEDNDEQKLAERFVVPEEADGARVDAVLAVALGDDWSRSRIKRELVSLTINGKPAKLSAHVLKGDAIEIVLADLPSFADLVPEAIPLEILHEDDDIIVINKPWGMAVHPSGGTPSGTVVNALLHHCRNLPVGDPLRPGIVHRLDKDTSGVMVCVKTERARIALSAAFQNREVEKTYAAIVKGRISPRQGMIDAPIGRDPANRTRQAVTPDGREARTGYSVLEEFSSYSYLKIDLFTGRTHQIRVHLSWKDHPIIGDPIYSRRDALTDRLCLAAVRLGFPHPVTGEMTIFTAPLPSHMNDVLGRLRQPR